MASYKCEKCGETANSKCAVTRNVFPSNMFATMIGNCVKYEANRRGATDEKYRREEDSDVWTMTITFPYVKGPQNDQEAIEECTKMFVETSKETLKIALCDHRWSLVDDKCDMGCCERRLAA